MIKYTLVMPCAYAPYAEACVDSLKLDRENMLIIDNTEDNKGVAESWNMGIDKMRKDDTDWLIIVSAAMRFGAEGGLDMLEQIESHKFAKVIDFAIKDFKPSVFIRGKSPGVEGGNFSWHCTAIRRDIIDQVGYFDSNFHPIYFEDIDYDLRLQKSLGTSLVGTTWLILPIDATDEGIGHGVKLGGIKAPAEPNLLYFCQKWGRMPDAAQLGEYDTPFNDPNNTLAFFPPAHGRLWK